MLRCNLFRFNCFLVIISYVFWFSIYSDYGVSVIKKVSKLFFDKRICYTQKLAQIVKNF